jgi:hypothetical protein
MSDLVRGLPGGDDLGRRRRFLARARAGEADVAEDVPQIGAARLAACSGEREAPS